MKFDDLLPAINPIIQRAVRNTEKMTAGEGEHSILYHTISFSLILKKKKEVIRPVGAKSQGGGRRLS